MTPRLMTIGTFSSLTRLSVRMLRHYDAHGVLVPADIDDHTGYRRYAVEQLATATDIRNLRDVGFSVSAIGALLAARGSPTFTSALEAQRRVLTDDVHAARGRLTLINRLLNQGAPAMPISLTRTTIPAMTIATLRATVPTYADEGHLWQRFTPLLGDVTPIGPCGVIEHDRQYTERDVDLSVFMPVTPGTTLAEPAGVFDLPERECLIAEVRGPYDQIPAAWDAINQRIADDHLAVASGDALADRAFNRYLVTPEEGTDELVTEVCVPLEAAPGA